MNLELRGGILDGALLMGYDNAEPGRLVRVAKLPHLKMTPNGMLEPMDANEVVYVITHEVNKNGDVVADVKNNP